MMIFSHEPWTLDQVPHGVITPRLDFCVLSPANPVFQVTCIIWVEALNFFFSPK